MDQFISLVSYYIYYIRQLRYNIKGQRSLLIGHEEGNARNLGKYENKRIWAQGNKGIKDYENMVIKEHGNQGI